MGAYYANQVTTEGVEFPSPEKIGAYRYGEFIRVPRGSRTLWSFRHKIDAEAFIKDFPEHAQEGGK